MDMNDVPFQEFTRHRDAWAVKDDYHNPGGLWRRRVRRRRGAVRRRGLVEHDAVAADREARLSEAHPAAARATERDQPDLFARLRRHAHRLGDRGDGGRDLPAGDYQEATVDCAIVLFSIPVFVGIRSA